MFLLLPTGEKVFYSSRDKHIVAAHSWSRYKRKNILYAKTSFHRKTVYLHRLIMKATERYDVIDHVDGDGLNCRRENLRRSLTSQNAYNSKSRQGTSIYKGVSWSKSYLKWLSQIRIAGKRRHVGYFENEIDAALAYDEYARKFHGEFARLNFPIQSEQSAIT